MMPPSFRSKIRSALANPNLQAALDANAERRLQVRIESYRSLEDDFQVLRRRAHKVRAGTIQRLDRYLAQFTERAQANGLIVHRAADATQAVQIILKIAEEKGAKLVAKSKSMVSEEIRLNPALEAAGLKVIETDLGEFIVQLRGEHPAHIITPAVHLRRQEVGQTFHEKLGLPLTEDIGVMTAAARRTLRQAFLEADIGLSGVNFGVAETGGLCLVTNEGNGRMVTTLPAVHIALMGIERLVPTMDDLALMLSLLPRSATGQKITVYTSLIHGPRRPGEPDGPGERHLVLLDNGRDALRSTPLAEVLLCIRCGACLNACPVFREIGGHAYTGARGEDSPYPGPIGSIVSPALFGQPEFGHLARASSLCGACKEACPVDIDLPKLLLRVRAGGKQLARQRPNPNAPPALALGLRLYTWIATHPRRFAAAQRLAGILGRIFPSRAGWLRLPAATGWGYSKDFPRPAGSSFRARWEARERNISLTSQRRSSPPPSLSGIGESSNEPSEKISQGSPTARSEAAVRQSEVNLQTNPTHLDINSSGASASQSPISSASLAKRFASELSALGGTAVFCSHEDLPERILDALRGHEVDCVHTWEADTLPDGLLERLEAGGIRLAHQADPAVRAGLTGAVAAVAETGTLVLPGGEGRPLTASLLPEIHIAVLREGQIVKDLAQVLRLEPVLEASSVALISGPSRTADIEMTLTIGVHGPGVLQVFCIP